MVNPDLRPTQPDESCHRLVRFPGYGDTREDSIALREEFLADDLPNDPRYGSLLSQTLTPSQPLAKNYHMTEPLQNMRAQYLTPPGIEVTSVKTEIGAHHPPRVTD